MAEHELPVLQDHDLRLRPARLPDDVSAAIPWYHDPEVLHFSEGEGTPPYDAETIGRMYEYLADEGELYIIEIRMGDDWRAVGDAALLPDDLAIVIGEQSHRTRGLGKRAVRLMVQRARSLGWDAVKVGKVFTYNERSKRLFESLGFEIGGTGTDDEGRAFWHFTLPLRTRGGV